MFKRIMKKFRKRKMASEVIDSEIYRPIEAITKTIYKQMGSKLTRSQCHTLAEAIVYDDLDLAATVLTNHQNKQYYN